MRPAGRGRDGMKELSHGKDDWLAVWSRKGAVGLMPSNFEQQRHSFVQSPFLPPRFVPVVPFSFPRPLAWRITQGRHIQYRLAVVVTASAPPGDAAI